jgi:ring-1,2-phenylacetyl-CoA epoxidase subunit PaaC
MSELTETVDQDVAGLLLRLGDDALILAQRLSEWYAMAPRLEDDIALLNIALDYVGHARALLTMAGEREGRGRYEDELAFLRADGEFTNARLMELPNGDFGRTIVRIAVVSLWHVTLFAELENSIDREIAAFASKAVVECRFHVQYATLWLDRLLHGTEESARRIKEGFDYVWPYVGELFADDDLTRRLAAAGVVPSAAVLEAAWLRAARAVFTELGVELRSLERKELQGREGRHLEAFVPLIAEMQHVHRSHPGATW